MDLRQRSWKWYLLEEKWISDRELLFYWRRSRSQTELLELEEKWISDRGLGNGTCWRRRGSQISDLSGSQVLEMVFAGGKWISDRAVGTGVNWRRSGYQPELV